MLPALRAVAKLNLGDMRDFWRKMGQEVTGVSGPSLQGSLQYE